MACSFIYRYIVIRTGVIVSTGPIVAMDGFAYLGQVSTEDTPLDPVDNQQ